MTGTVAIIVKIMPDSPQADLEEIKAEIKKFVEKNGAQNISFEEQSIAFGLKAIFLKMAFPEDKGTDMLETNLTKIPHISSVTIEDYRRAFG